MRCVVDPDLATFAAQVLPHLHRDPVRNNVANTIVAVRHDGSVPVEPDAVWLRVVDDDGALVSVAMRTPPHPLLLTDGPPEAADAVAEQVLAAGLQPPLVTGPVGLVHRFVERWSAATGRGAAEVMGMRMFRLDRVVPPRGVRGRLRPATRPDRGRLVDWISAFHAEANPEGPQTDAAATIDRALDRAGALWVWEVDEEPVSIMVRTPPVAGVVRINAVYTPPAHRGHGYASAAVAALSQRILDRDAGTCVLYTDRANPTSNKIYQEIGYRPVADTAVWRLPVTAG